MDGLELLNAMIDTIINDSTERLKEICDKLPLNLISVESSDRLLAQLLDMTAHWNRVESASILYEAWQQTNFEEERFSLVAYMMGRPLFSDRAILIAMKTKDDFTFSSLFDEIISRDDSPETLAALRRLFKLLGTPPYDALLDLRQKIIELELKEDLPLPRMRGFINSYIEDSSPFAQRPKYIISQDPLKTAGALESITMDINITPEDLSLTEKVNLLTAGLALQGISLDEIEDSKAKLRTELEFMSKEDQQVLLSPVLEDLSFNDVTENQELYKIFGPNHPVYGMDLDDSDKADPCQRFGGCRMFLCVCSETPHDEDELGRNEDILEDPDETEWFRTNEKGEGVCDFCHQKIEKKCYAVRRPCESGSWISCFCRWKCVHDDTPEDDLVTHSLIDLMEDKMNKIGIYDRSYPVPKEKEEE